MVHEIVEDVYDITLREGKGRRYRAFLFDGPTPTLIDVGHDGYEDALFAGVEEIGIEPERLLVTHGDSDHIGCFDAVVERYDLETWVPAMTELDARHEPDHRIEDGDIIGQFTAVHVPGHAHDNMVFVDEDRGIAVMGDALMGSDIRGMPAGYVVLPPEMWSANLHEAERSLEKLLDYEFEVMLLYHGSSITSDARAKLDRFVNFPHESIP